MPRNYNRYNQHRMTLNTVGFEPAVFNPIQFQPVEADYNILERSFAKQEERKQNAIQQQTALQAAIAQVELAPEEDQWKQDYINNINNQINAAAQVGDYAGALNTATQLAGRVSTDPSLLGRERYNKERQTFLQQLEQKHNSGLISDDTYVRAKAQNVYNYEDVLDPNGNVVGGRPWEAQFNPLNDISLDSVLDWMMKYKGVSSETIGGGGGASNILIDRNGNRVNNVSDATGILGTQRGGSRTEQLSEITLEDWREAFQAYLAEHQGDEARLNQLWDNARFNLEQLVIKASDPNISEDERRNYESRINNVTNSLTDADGGLLTKDDWLFQSLDPAFRVMAYRKHSLVTEAGSTLYDENVLRNRALASLPMFNNNPEAVELWGLGATMEYIDAFLKNDTEEMNSLKEQGRAFVRSLVD